MSSLWFTSSALLIASLLSTSADAQTFKARKFAEVGGWTVNANLADGQYMNCGAVAPGPAYAAFEKSTEGWTLTFASKAKGDRPKGSLDLDGKVTNLAFDLFEPGKYGTFLKAPQIKALQGAKVLTVKTSADEIRLDLGTLPAVLARVEACVKANSR